MRSNGVSLLGKKVDFCAWWMGRRLLNCIDYEHREGVGRGPELIHWVFGTWFAWFSRDVLNASDRT